MCAALNRLNCAAVPLRIYSLNVYVCVYIHVNGCEELSGIVKYRFNAALKFFSRLVSP